MVQCFIAEGIINAEDDAEKSKKPNGDKPNGDKLHHPLVVSTSVEKSPRFVRKKEVSLITEDLNNENYVYVHTNRERHSKGRRQPYLRWC